MDGGLIAGDAGGFLNSMRLKGIHLAMRTGMLAAETAFEAVRAGDTSIATLKSYQDRIDNSAVKAELYPGSQRPPGVRLRAVSGACVRGAVGGDPRLDARGSPRPSRATSG